MGKNIGKNIRKTLSSKDSQLEQDRAIRDSYETTRAGTDF